MPGQQRRHGVPIRHVTRREHHIGAQRGQFRTQLLRTLGGRTTPAHQHQAPDIAFRDQMPGDQATERARRTGDQNGARTEPGILHHRTLDPGQTRDNDHTRPHRQLRLTRCQGRRQRLRRYLVLVHVDQHEPVRVLRLRRTHQTPHRRLRQPRHLITGTHSNRTPGHDHQTRALLRQPGLHRGQRPVRHLVGRGRRIGTGWHRAGKDGEVGQRRLRARPADRGEVAAGQRDRHPVQAEQRVAGAVAGQLLLRDRAQHQRVHRRDRGARAVRHRQGHPVLARRRQAYPQQFRAGGVQAHTRPGERQPAGSAGIADQADGVQRRVEQGRVQAEALRPHTLGQRHFGVDLAVEPPGRPQALEHRSVPETGLGHVVVEAVQGDGLGTGGRPLRQRDTGGAGSRAEQSGGMPGPRAAVVTRAGVEADLPAARSVRGADRHLHERRAVCGQDQRRLQGQFLHDVAADLVTRADRQLGERRPGQQDRAEHGVVGEPRVAAYREPSGQQCPVRAAEDDGRAQQGVFGRAEPGRRDIPHRGQHGRPVTLALERIGRQFHPAAAVAAEERLPVHAYATDMQLPRSSDNSEFLRSVSTQHGHEHRVRQRLLTQRRQHATGPDLNEDVSTRGNHRVSEPDRLAHMPHPVVG
ncbi:hypothetical protein Ahu01nite_089630 [Winogradskya humida]|uniref:Uncharacterized protein n=1 Tax=Winogradskya humida TaxID=113566 RepID=A0ABQ4A4T1_9ACTN|nr:hypothetical protein Ahu01nite_089630 [Actinoplanes humidus]